jgi:tight adherence protein B
VKRVRLLLGALLSAVVLGGPALALAADDPAAVGPFLAIRAVDATGGDVVRLTLAYDGEAADLESATIVDNGEERPLSGDVVPLAATGVQRAVVIAVDTSEAVDPVMADLRDGVSAIVAGLPSGTPISIVTFADRFVPNRRLTTDVNRLEETIASLHANGESSLWNGVEGAAGILANDAPEAQPTVVLMTASGSVTSTVEEGAAVGELRNAGAPLYVIGLEGGRLDPGELEDAVARSGGRMLTTTDSEQLDELGAAVAGTIDRQYVVTYEPPTGEGAGSAVDLTVVVGDTFAQAAFVRGALMDTPAELTPPQPVGARGVGFLHGDLAKYGGIALILAAAALAAFSLIQLAQPDDSHLSNVLQPYAEGFIDEPGEDEEGGLARTALIQRAVDFTEGFAERQGFLARAEAMLERADLPLRAAEALFFYAAVTAMITLLGLVITRNILGAAAICAIAAMLPPALVNMRASRRLKKFNAQLPDMLVLLSGTLRAGYSLMQGVEAVSREVEDPIGYELRRVVTESRLGRPLEEALEGAADRMGSADFSWAVMAIGIQREVGGNLAELLMTVADTMTQRERLRRDVAALTAEGKVSAAVLGILPLGLAAAMYVINPEYIGLLFSEKIGNMMLIGAGLLAGFGFWWMKKLVQVDV